MEACLRSFRVMVLVAPLHVILLLVRYSDATIAAEDMEVFFAETLGYVVEWLLFPVIFHEIARRRGWLDRYARYIGALNWINLPGMALAVVFVPLALALGLGGCQLSGGSGEAKPAPLAIGEPVTSEITLRDRVNYGDGTRTALFAFEMAAGES